MALWIMGIVLGDRALSFIREELNVRVTFNPLQDGRWSLKADAFDRNGKPLIPGEEFFGGDHQPRIWGNLAEAFVRVNPIPPNVRRSPIKPPTGPDDYSIEMRVFDLHGILAIEIVEGQPTGGFSIRAGAPGERL